MRRRDFVRTGLAGAALIGGRAGRPRSGGEAVCLVADPADEVAASASARWALGELGTALASRGVTVREAESVELAAAPDSCIVASGRSAAGAALAVAAPRAPSVRLHYRHVNVLRRA